VNVTEKVDLDELNGPNDLAGLQVVINGRLEHHKRGESRDLVNGLGPPSRSRSPSKPI